MFVSNHFWSGMNVLRITQQDSYPSRYFIIVNQLLQKLSKVLSRVYIHFADRIFTNFTLARELVIFPFFPGREKNLMRKLQNFFLFNFSLGVNKLRMARESAPPVKLKRLRRLGSPYCYDVFLRKICTAEKNNIRSISCQH